MSADEFIVVPAAAAGADGVAALTELVAELGPSQLKSLVGPPDAPRRAIVTLPAEAAAALSQRYAGRLVVERNEELSLTGDDHA